jgi:heme A synthase
MTDPLPRPVPRWLHRWAILAVVATLVLLAIGQLVTSFGAGMADRVWPTEPWYVFRTATEDEKARFRSDFAFFIEHSHRIAGWTVGGIVIVLAVGALWTEPRKAARGAALAGLFVLVVSYGDFHRGLMAQKDVSAKDVVLPQKPMLTALAGAALMIAATLAGSAGKGLRVLGALALVAVMIQGLLGGFRVKLNELVGTDLAAFHGVFAQVVFGLLAWLAVATARPALLGSVAEARKLHRAASVFAHLIFIQVIFGAWVRHFPGPLPQRLHFLTAFAATALAVWLLRAVYADPAARARAGRAARWLTVLLVVQLVLGVEAWLAKFGAELVKVTPQSGATRTLHALVGSGVWAVSLALSLRLRPAARPVHKVEPVGTAGAPAVKPV